MSLKIKLHEEAPSTVVSFPGQPSDTYTRMLAEIESLKLKKLDSEHWVYKRDAAEGIVGLNYRALSFELKVKSATVYKNTIMFNLGNISASELTKAMMEWVAKMSDTYYTAGKFMLKMP